MKRHLVLAIMLLGAIHFAYGQADSDTPAPAPDATAPATDSDEDTSPYHVALVNYKSGDYEKARADIDEAEKAKPGDLAIEVLKARIMTEQHDYAEGEKLLHGLIKGDGPFDAVLALGDLLLSEHSFDRAAKYYDIALKAKPNDPDIILKMVYAKVGSSDLVGAGKYSSQLSPMDPKNPYDDHASYYFSRAAIAQATGNSQAADDSIQTARTIYGITVANHYLRTYLQVFAPTAKNSDMTPAPLTKPTRAE